MSTRAEKTAFAQRLQIALDQLVLKATPNPNVKTIKGATDLARQFNLRHHGAAGITVQAAHKWLKGQVIPTNDKIKTLAEWLGVGEYWLHYGPLPEAEALKAKLMPSLSTLKLVEEIEILPVYQRYLIEELVKQFDKHTSC